MGYTPGPWYKSSTGNHQGLVISEATGENVAVTYNGDTDAALIAAAPELLEACKQAVATLEMLRTNGWTLDILRSAIAKATGPDIDLRRETLEEDARDIEIESEKGAKR